MGQVADFLRLIYGGNGQFPGRVALCRFERSGAEAKRIEWITPDTLDVADAKADECRKGDGADLYYGVCPMSDGVVLGRGKAADVVGCPGVWADLDFAAGAGKKKSRRKYPSREHAEQLIERLSLKPSLVVDTGGGWHVYWLFHDVLRVETDEQRAEVARLVAGWQRHLARELDRLGGYELDPTQDLPRVLRPAGAWSCRWGRNTSIVEGYGLADWRHYRDDIEAMIPDDLVDGTASLPIRTGTADVDPFRVDPEGQVDAGMLDALLENDADFAALWNHRRELRSSSEQELALANIAAEAGWVEQQIANLIIMHRRKNEPGKIDKALRPDYLRVTIGKAKKHAAQKRSLTVTPEELQLRDAATSPTAGDDVKDDARAEVLRLLSAQLGITVLGFSQLGRDRDTARYYLTVADESADDGLRELEIGPVTAISGGPKALTEALLVGARHRAPAINRKDWATVVDRLMFVSSLTEMPDGGEMAAVEELLRAHLRSCKCYPARPAPSEIVAKNAAIKRGEAFVDSGVAYVTLGELAKLARITGSLQPGRASGQISRCLLRSGWSRVRLNWRLDGRHSTRSYYERDAAALVAQGVVAAADDAPHESPQLAENSE